MFKMLSNIVEGTVGVAVNTALLPVAAAAAVVDEGDFLEETVERVGKNVRKIGSDK